MRIIQSFFYRICFWHRDWQMVKSINEAWETTYPPFTRYNPLSGIDKTVPYSRALILEKCKITNFERAYYYDKNGKEKVPVGYAKAMMGIK